VIDFFFPKKLHRLSYVLRILITNGALCFLRSYCNAYGSGVWVICLVLAILYQIFFIAVPRVRDIGMNSWWVLLALMPGVNFIFGIILAFRAPVVSRPPTVVVAPGAGEEEQKI